MANVIKLRKGLDISLKGKPSQEWLKVKDPGFYSLVPDDFTGVTPKVVVKEQEYVMAGGPLFIDKNHPELKFVSPVSGVVTSVERGARRKVLNIVVEAAAEQDYEEFGTMNPAQMTGEEVKQALLSAGLFAFVRQRPYDVIADPTVQPKAIFVSAFDSSPLAPDFEFVLKGEEKGKDVSQHPRRPDKQGPDRCERRGCHGFRRSPSRRQRGRTNQPPLPHRER